MPQIGPFVKLFLALLVVLVALFGWQRADMAALETRLGEHFDERFTRIDERLDRLETGQSELRERMARLEAGQSELRERMARLEVGQTELRERVARLEVGQTELRERVARIEGTVAGALSRPGSLAQAVEDGQAGAN